MEPDKNICLQQLHIIDNLQIESDMLVNRCTLLSVIVK